MTMSRALKAAFLVVLYPGDVLSLAFKTCRSMKRRSFLVPSFLAMVPQEESSETLDEPYFQMQSIPTGTATSGSKLDHIVQCADESGQCDIEEMARMIEELERLNLECSGTLSRECSLDAVAARNVLKVALAAKVAAEAELDECNVLSDNPYSEMHQMNDEYVDKMHQVPTATTTKSRLDHIVQCAENGVCDVEEMTLMIDELERLNMDCEGPMSRECSLDAVEARNILKVALASQVATAELSERD